MQACMALIPCINVPKASQCRRYTTSWSLDGKVPHRASPKCKYTTQRLQRGVIHVSAAAAPDKVAQPGVTRVGFLGLGIMGTLMVRGNPPRICVRRA